MFRPEQMDNIPQLSLEEAQRYIKGNIPQLSLEEAQRYIKGLGQLQAALSATPAGSVQRREAEMKIYDFSIQFPNAFVGQARQDQNAQAGNGQDAGGVDAAAVAPPGIPREESPAFQPLNPAKPASPASLVNPTRNAMPQQPQENPLKRFRGGNLLQHPQAQMIMDNMDLPPQVTQLIPGIPPSPQKWGQFKEWASKTNAPIPDQQKQMLRHIQLAQFKRLVMSHGQGEVPQQPGAPTANAFANLPPNTPMPNVTPQEIQQFRMSQQNFREAPEEQIKAFIQRLKIQRIRQVQARADAGQQPPGQTGSVR
jgi:hypothetical protein